MNISEFGYQRLIQQVERVTGLCVQASSRTKVPQTLRDLRTIGTEAEEIKIILAEYIKPDPPKGGGKKEDKPKLQANDHEGAHTSPGSDIAPEEVA